MRSPLLFRSSRRYLLRHPWQIGLSVLGVAIAVAVVAGIDLANASAYRAFGLSVEGVAGRATHEIAAGPRGVDEALYAELRTTASFRRLAPVVEGWVTTERAPGRPLRLFGTVGSAFGSLGALILLVVGIQRLMGTPLAGRPILVLGTLLLGLGVQAFTIGLLGELLLFFHARNIRDYRIAQVYEAEDPPLSEQGSSEG